MGVHKYSVSELNDKINICLTTEFKNSITIIGEISGYKLSRGHAYFTLKDEASSISCIIWSSTLSKFKNNLHNLHNGDKIIGTGKISTYKKSGSYQLIIYKIECDGLGNIHKKYNELKEKMEYKGYFDEKHKKKLPNIINNIGIITAENGAALHDVIFALKSKNFYGKIYFENCSVQGNNCPKTVCEAINVLCKKDIDVILITRGGGSFEDLMGFSDEKLIKKIYNCPICVISAIGHEIDFMLSDFVADIRAPTPSIAGSMIVDKQIELNNSFNNIVLSNRMIMGNIVNKLRDRVNNIKQKLINPAIILKEQRLRINKLADEINLNIMNKLSMTKNKLEYLKSKFEIYNPDKKLTGGLNMLLTDDGKIINSVNFFKNRKFINNLTLKMSDGEISVKILI